MEDPQEVSIADLVEILRKGLVSGVVLALLAAALGLMLSTRSEPIFRSRVTLLASQPGADSADFGVSLVTAPAVDVSAYRAASVSVPVLEGALTGVRDNDVTSSDIVDLRKRTTVRTEETRSSALVHIEVQGRDPKVASEEADSIGQALLEWDRHRATRNLDKIIESLRAQIEALDVQIEEEQSEVPDLMAGRLEALQGMRARYVIQLNSANALRSSAVGRLEVLEPASVPLHPVPNSPWRNALLGFVLGMFANYLIVLLREAMNTRFRGTEDLARFSGLPLLAEFPEQAGMRRLPREASSYLRTNLQFLTASDHPKLILVTSADSEQGKSSVALSLAESFARNGYRTLLIDADLRKPVLASEYGLDPRLHIPLRFHLEHFEEEYSAASVVVDDRCELSIIPSFGSAPDPTELLSQRFAKFIQKQAQVYDAIVIDSAPVLPVADTLTIAPHVTGVVFAASMADAEKRLVQAALEMLERLGVRVLGTVATRTRADVRRGVPKYGYGYGYAHSGTELENEMRPSSRAAQVGAK